jgi:hypothetical protein
MDLPKSRRLRKGWRIKKWDIFIAPSARFHLDHWALGPGLEIVKEDPSEGPHLDWVAFGLFIGPISLCLAVEHLKAKHF